jgi:hypothetical protein
MDTRLNTLAPFKRATDKVEVGSPNRFLQCIRTRSAPKKTLLAGHDLATRVSRVKLIRDDSIPAHYGRISHNGPGAVPKAVKVKKTQEMNAYWRPERSSLSPHADLRPQHKITIIRERRGIIARSPPARPL